MSTMRAWQYTAVKGGLESNLVLNENVPMITPRDPLKQHLVKVLHVCLNPVDYKPAEALPSFVIPKPATPGIDFAGEIVTPAEGSGMRKGERIFGVAALSPFAGGALSEYATVPISGCVPVPATVSALDASTIGVAGLTAYQSIMPHVRQGSRIFINGGSGGVGVFAIQIAKLAGCHVTTSCSSVNVELCQKLGADHVIDYKRENVVEALQKLPKIDHVVDNVGKDPQIYWQSGTYTAKNAGFIGVAGEPSLSYLAFSVQAKLLPFRGARPKFTSILAKPDAGELRQIGQWMADGKVKAVVDSTFTFEKVPDAFRRLKTGRSKGKIAVEVNGSKSAI